MNSVEKLAEPSTEDVIGHTELIDAIKRYEVIDCSISATNHDYLIEAIEDRVRQKKGGYVCFSNVHTVVTSKKDKNLRKVTNSSIVSAADGKPLSVVGRMKNVEDACQVAGPDFMANMLKHGRGIRHFFFGSTPETLEALVENVRERYEEARIAGSYSPPFRPASIDAIDEEAVKIIKEVDPDIVWVGLGAPKQEYWMYAHQKVLSPCILMGVGAAFDFHAGTIERAPEWMRKMGLEWLHRMMQEPRRLFKRYAVTNSMFLYYIVKKYITGLFGKR